MSAYPRVATPERWTCECVTPVRKLARHHAKTVSRCSDCGQLAPFLAPKRCPYCGGAHAERGAYCCRGHARSARSQNQAFGQGRARAMRRALETARARTGHRFRWRQIALGINEAEHLAVVFRPKRKRGRAA